MFILGWQHAILASCFALTASVLAVLLSPSRDAWATQDERTIGIYVTSLRNFDTAAALVTIVTRNCYNSGRVTLAKRIDLVSLLVFGLSFVLVNAVLIYLAHTAG